MKFDDQVDFWRVVMGLSSMVQKGMNILEKEDIIIKN